MNVSLNAVISELQDDMISFAQKIVTTKSLTGCEGAVAELVADKMQELGYDEVSIDEMGNVLGRIGTGPAALLFDSHMDTVTVNDAAEWSADPFGGEIRNGDLYGRGAADMKCSLVSSLYGAAAAKKLGLIEGEAVYVSASSMEEDYDGEAVRYLLTKTGLRPRGVVICEPTVMKVATGHRGRALIELHAEGVSCHASAPKRGKNPVFMLEELIRRVQRRADELDAQPGEHGDLALTNIYCTTASNNSVPSNATLILDRRLALGETEEIIAREMDALVAGTEVTWCFSDIPATSWKGQDFLFHSFLPAWEISPEDDFVCRVSAAFEEARGEKPELCKMSCSTNGVVTAGVFHLPTIVLGPGDLAYAHARDERCSIQNMVSAAGIYALMCGKM